MCSCSSNADMETSASLVYAITDNTLFHSSSHINQMLPQIAHTALLSDRYVVLDIVVNWNGPGLFGGYKSGSSYG